MKYKGVEELYFPNYTYDKEVFMSNLNRLDDIEKEDLKNFLSFLRKQNNKPFNESESGLSLIKLHKLEKFLQNLFQEDITFSTKRAGWTGTEKGFQSFIPQNVLEELYSAILKDSEKKTVIEIKNTFEKVNHKRYLILDNDEFIHNGSPLNLSHNTILFRLLKEVYVFTQGNSALLTYKDIFKITKKIVEYKKLNNDILRLKFRQHLTTNKGGVRKHIEQKETNNKWLFSSIRSKGVFFNNN